MYGPVIKYVGIIFQLEQFRRVANRDPKNRGFYLTRDDDIGLQYKLFCGGLSVLFRFPAYEYYNIGLRKLNCAVAFDNYAVEVSQFEKAKERGSSSSSLGDLIQRTL